MSSGTLVAMSVDGGASLSIRPRSTGRAGTVRPWPSGARYVGKLLVDGERGPSVGLVTGVAEIAPGGMLPRHHHEPEETYYVLSGRGEVEIEDVRTEIGPGTAVFIASGARHALHCNGVEPLVFLFTFARDRFEEVVYHFDVQSRSIPSSERPNGAGS